MERWLILKPRKPSSSKRKVVRIRILRKNKTVRFYGYVPGETYGKTLLREYNQVFLEPIGKRDLANVNFRVKRGMLDCPTVQLRTSSRSQYSIKRKLYLRMKDTYCTCQTCTSCNIT